MPLEIDKRKFIFKIKEIWFADYPYDVQNYSSVKFLECKNKINREGFFCEEFTTLIIDLTQSLEDIWKNMDPKSCRYEINRAIKEGIKIWINKNYEEFYKINASFRKVKGLSDNLLDVDFMKKYCTLFTSELNGEIVAGQLYLEDKNNIRWLIGASKRLEVDSKKARLIGCANRLMIWEAIKYAKEKGIKEFDLGGYYTGKIKDEQKEKINLFKKSFGGKLVTYYHYYKDYSIILKFIKKCKKYIKLLK
jgi:lipid II:glycine glycyltransferase (peptidoglycan interpeptide bridge formation enzyme)